MLDAHWGDYTKNLLKVPRTEPLPLQLEAGRGLHDPQSWEERQDVATVMEADCSAFMSRQRPGENYCKAARHDSYAAWTSQPSAWGRIAETFSS